MPTEASLLDMPLPVVNLSTSTDITNFQWLINSEPYSNLEQPVFDFSSSGIYTITLIARSINNCESDSSREVYVKSEFAVFIPNAFTPNGDGLNDNFKPVFTKNALQEDSFSMEIFDRWGHEVFYGNSIEPGWNGAFKNKGEVVKQGVYTYIIQYKDYEGKPHTRTGHVSLNR